MPAYVSRYCNQVHAYIRRTTAFFTWCRVEVTGFVNFDIQAFYYL